MPIVGFNIKSISAKTEDRKSEEKVDINSTPTIESIKKHELNVPGVKDVLSIEFSFVTKYEPNIGEISIRGEVFYQTEDTKKILSMWKDKRLEPKLAVDVLNVIFKKCLSRAVGIADDLRLPPPLTFPIVKTESKKEATGG